MRGAIGIGCLFLSFISVDGRAGCTSTAEFVGTLEYLRDQKEMALPEAKAREIAERVSQGCTGSAHRFMSVVEVLKRSEVPSPEALNLGTQLASRTDRETETFVEVFKVAFLAEYLDMDLGASIGLARSLSREFEGDVLAVREDFEKIVEFCVSEEGLGLSRPACGALGGKIARLGQDLSGGVAQGYIDLYHFLAKEGVATGAALKVAEQVIASGSGASENFIQGYRYAVSDSGLSLPQAEALKFGKRMALQTSLDRAPAQAH